MPESGGFNASLMAAIIADTETNQSGFPFITSHSVGYVSAYNHTDYYGNSSVAYCYEVLLTVAENQLYKLNLILLESSNNTTNACNGTVEVHLKAQERRGAYS